jgi:hypothetical protein
MKPDVIVTWPRNCDYPLWRQFIRDNRERFNLVLIVFMETNSGEDYRDFVKQSMFNDYVLFLENPQTNGDWRNSAVNHALIQSYNAGWLWFTEQDFTTDNVGFWHEVSLAAEAGNEVVTIKEGNRMHPCCMFIKREALAKTSLDFSVDTVNTPPTYDHFGRIQKDIESQNIPTYIVPQGYHHMAGLSHNMHIVSQGGMPNYKAEEFNQYLKEAMAVSVPLDPRYKQWVNDYFIRAGIS